MTAKTAKKPKLSSEERSRIAKEAWAARRAKKQALADVAEKMDEVASEAAAEDPVSVPVAAKIGEALKSGGKPQSGKVRVIHFVEDGFTVGQKLFYRGEELRVVEGSPEWKRMLDRDGKCWMDLTEQDQLDKYERVFFKEGPWRGKKGIQSEDEYLQALQSDDLEAVKRAEKKRQREVGVRPPGSSGTRED